METSFTPIWRYFGDLREILLRPRAFFARMPREGGLSGPIAFALVTHWLGAAFQFLWGQAFGTGFRERLMQFSKLFERMTGTPIDSPGRGGSPFPTGDIAEWMWGAGFVIADPFLTGLAILSTSYLVWIGARLLAPREGVSYERAARVVAYGMSPAILAVIPFAGSFIAWVWALVVTTIGAQVVFGVSSGRALVIALFPRLFFVAMLFLGLFLLVAILFLVFGSLFA